MLTAAAKLLRLMLALAILIAGAPAHGAMAFVDASTNQPAAEQPKVVDEQPRCPGHRPEPPVEEELLSEARCCDGSECCADECRMSCAGGMSMLVLEVIATDPTHSARATTVIGRLHLSTHLPGLLRPPQA